MSEAAEMFAPPKRIITVDLTVREEVGGDLVNETVLRQEFTADYLGVIGRLVAALGAHSDGSGCGEIASEQDR